MNVAALHSHFPPFHYRPSQVHPLGDRTVSADLPTPGGSLQLLGPGDAASDLGQTLLLLARFWKAIRAEVRVLKVS